MRLISVRKVALVCVLMFSLFLIACTDAWIKVAQADLPILTQMALNIGSLASTLQGGELEAGEVARIQALSVEADKNLKLLQKLVNDFRATKDETTKQALLAQIQNVTGVINTNLPALLNALHIKNAELAARINAGTGLILATVASFAAILPQNQGTAAKAGPPPNPKDLKSDWNRLVANPTTSNAKLNAALSQAKIQ